MGIVTQKFTSDISQVEAAYAKLQAQNAKLINQNKQLARESQKSQRSQKGSMSVMQSAAKSATTQLIGMVGGYLSLQGAVSGVNALLNEQLRLSKSVAEFGARVAPSQEKLAFNMMRLSQEDQQKVISKIRVIAKETGFGREEVLNAAAGGLLSATSNEKLAFGVTENLAKMMKLSPDAIGTAASAAGDLASTMGDNEGSKAIGLVLSTMESSRIQDINKFNLIARGIALSTGFEAEGVDKVRSTEVAAGLEAALSRGLKDETGEVTKTATVGLARQLAAFLPELGTLESRIAAVQKDPELRRKFFDGDIDRGIGPARFDQSEAVVKTLLSNPNSEVARDFQKNISGAVTADASLVAMFQKTLDGLTPETMGQGFVHADKANRDAFMANNPELADYAHVANALLENLPLLRDPNRSAAAGLLDDTMDMNSFRLSAGLGGANPTEVAAGIYRSRQQSILYNNDAAQIGVDEAGNAKFSNIDLSKLDGEEREVLQLAQEQLEELRRLNDNIKVSPALGNALAGAERVVHREAEN